MSARRRRSRRARQRYDLLLNENGSIVDDGIVAKLGQQRFWVNTTSAGVERTAAAFEEWLQCEYPHFQVAITSVTSRWANVTVTGPRAWDWLAAAGFDPALAPSRMRHMTVASSQWEGVPLCVLRASFSGELGYEVNVPADAAPGLFERLWTFAPRFDALPYGIEALETMRIEKGFIHVGTDTDGTTAAGRRRLRTLDPPQERRLRRTPIVEPARVARSRPIAVGRAGAQRWPNPAAGRRTDRAGKAAGRYRRPCDFQRRQRRVAPADRARDAQARCRSGRRAHPGSSFRQYHRGPGRDRTLRRP